MIWRFAGSDWACKAIRFTPTTEGIDMKPSVGRIVHYVSYGTPGGEYPPACRAAMVTDVGAWVTTAETAGPEAERDGVVRSTRTLAQEYHADAVALLVQNPTGVFFNGAGTVPCRYHDVAEAPGDPDCPVDHAAGPHRYCACGWTEATLIGGTWHWPERVE